MSSFVGPQRATSAGGAEVEAEAIRSGETAQHVAHVAHVSQQQLDAGLESG
jgi:hypothetical protein